MYLLYYDQFSSRYDILCTCFIMISFPVVMLFHVLALSGFRFLVGMLFHALALLGFRFLVGMLFHVLALL